MKASVVVPVRNGERVIARCLAALAYQDLPLGDLEMVVVDDGSSDSTAEVVSHYPDVRLLSQPPRGPAAARNLGVHAARARVVLFTDADCAPRADWARTLLEALETTGAAGAKGTYSTAQRSLVARFVQVEYETKYLRMRRRDSIDFVDTYSAAYRREVLLEVGGFDERLPSTSLADQELSFRIAGRGHRLTFVPEAVVDHLHASTLRAYARKKASIGYWKVAVLHAHPSKALDDAHTPQSLKVQVALTGLLGVALPVAVLWRPAGAIVAGLGLALVASWLPFLVYAARRDRAVAMAAPVLLLVRAAALGVGLVWGLLRGRAGSRRSLPAQG
jgi:GT2 family glycosyltransferase